MVVTMKTIAERCGVSKTLVSRILSEDPTLRVAPETRKKVLTVVEELQYHRNPNARILASYRASEGTKHYRIGYLSFSSRKHTGHPYFSRIIDGIIEEASRHHALIPIGMGMDQAKRQIKALEEQYENNPLDGLILLGRVDDDAVRQLIQKIARYVVCMDGPFDKNSDYVGTDSAKSILLALKHFMKLGYTDYGLLHGNDRRREACKEWFEEHGFTMRPEWEVNGEFTVDITKGRVAEVLAEHKPPRAIVACNDEMAIGAISALRNAGYRVPEDVAVIGYDDIPLAAYVDVPISTIHVYKKELGRMAVKILMDRIETRRKPPIHLEISSKLVKRESCGWRLDANKLKS